MSSEAFFARLAVGILPPPLLELIREKGLGILNWGCGAGGAVPVLAEAFAGSEIVGMGLETADTEAVRGRHPGYKFVDAPPGQPISVVYCADVLQKLEQPLGLLRVEVLPIVGDFLILLVPYQELPLRPGHVTSFNATSFPPRLEELGMIFWRALPTGQIPGSPWPGQQLMVIYARRQAVGVAELIPALMAWESQVVKRG